MPYTFRIFVNGAYKCGCKWEDEALSNYYAWIRDVRNAGGGNVQILTSNGSVYMSWEG